MRKRKTKMLFSMLLTLLVLLSGCNGGATNEKGNSANSGGSEKSSAEEK